MALEHWEEFLIWMNLLFSTKLMERYRMRFMGLDFATAHFPGNLLYTTGSLCRSPQEGKARKPESWNDPRQVLYEWCAGDITYLDQLLGEIRSKFKNHDTLNIVMQYVQNGWPEESVHGSIGKHWKERSNIYPSTAGYS